MFWIYIPPVIFIAALIALVVILGKKTAILKSREERLDEKSDFAQTGIPGMASEKWHAKFGKSLLKFAQKLISFAQLFGRKSQAGFSGIFQKLKERKTQRKDAAMMPFEEKRVEEHKISNEDFRAVQPETEKEDIGKSEFFQDVSFVHEEVVVKKKPETQPKRMLPEMLPEDKVREEALIYRIAENPKDIEAYRELGDYYFSVGNIKDAKESFKMVLKLRPRDLKAKSSLREIELKMRLKMQ